MKKIIFLFGFLLAIQFAINAQQTPPSLQWKKSNNGYSSANNEFIKSWQDGNGNIYALSRTEYHFMVIKFNTSGGIDKTYEYNNFYNGGDYPNDFKVDNSGNVYICGWSWINYTYFLTIVKFDPSGTILWTKNLQSGTWIYGKDYNITSIAIDPTNNVLFTGSVNDSLCVGKLNTSGNLLWFTKFSAGGNYLGRGYDIVSDASGAAFITGHIGIVGSNTDAFTAKINSNGVFSWDKVVIGAASSDDYGSSIKIDNSSNVYVGMNIADLAANNFSPYLVKYNASGAQQWQKNYSIGGQADNKFSCMSVDAIGNSYFVTHHLTGAFVGDSRIYRVTSFGNQTYTATVDDVGMNDNFVTGVSTDINGNLYYTGYNSGAILNIFYGKLNSIGSQMFYNTYTFGGAGFVSFTSSIHCDNSSNFNIISRTFSSSSYILDIRFNNSGAYQWEGIYSGVGNPSDENIRLITQGNNSIYSMGTVNNAGTNADVLLSKYDNLGNILWQNMIDLSSGNNVANDMGNDQNFNIYLAAKDNNSSFVSKYDSIGSQIWTKPFTLNYSKIHVDNNGNSYLAALTDITSNYNVFPVLKLDAAGNQIYQVANANTSNYYLEPLAVALDGNNRFVVAGRKTFDYFGSNKKVNLIVQKFSTTGNLLWSKEIPNVDSVGNYASYYTRIKSVLIDGNNDIYVYGGSNFIAPFTHDFSFIAKYNGSGTLLWRQNYNNNDFWHEEPGELILTGNNELMMFGAASGFGFTLTKLNRSNGSVIWLANSFNTSTYVPYSLEETSNKEYFLGGHSYNTSTGRAIHIQKVDSLGNFIWEKVLNGDYVGDDEMRDMKVTNQGRIYIVGKMVDHPALETDAAVLKLCDINQPTLTTAGNFNGICPGSSVVLQASNGTAYAWNTPGQTDSTITVNTAGAYFCTVYKYDGCAKNTDTINVIIKSAPNVPQICLVTVDTMSMHNIVYWDKTSIAGADSFKIYREDVTNVYTHIATVDADSLSEYDDLGANPNVTTKRYKLSAIDSCGNESAMSNYHNTLYIVDNGNGQFSWNPLYTIENSPNPVNNYVLMVDTNSSNNWIQASITAGTQNTLVDPNYNNYTNAQYRVETIWNITCSPTRGVINTTRSNIKSASRVGIQSQQAFNNSLSLMPNPAVSTLNLVYTGNASDLQKIEIFDSKGQTVLLLEKPNNNNIQMNVESFNPGVYQMRITGLQGTSIKRFIHN